MAKDGNGAGASALHDARGMTGVACFLFSDICLLSPQILLGYNNCMILPRVPERCACFRLLICTCLISFALATRMIVILRCSC